MNTKNRISKFTVECKKMLLSTNDFELIIEALKNLGSTQGESAMAISKAAGMSLYDANELLLNSKSWEGHKNQNDLAKEAFLRKE